jgi:hypothetical protein
LLFMLKPRVIVNFPPLTIGKMIAGARSLADYMHEIFDGRVYAIGKIRLRILFASGLTQEQLTKHFSTFRTSGDPMVFVAGDDSIMNASGHELGLVDSEGKQISALADADFSQFDQSQDEGALVHLMSHYGPKLGWSEEFMEYIQKACTMRYTFNGRDIRIKGFAGMMMPTGIPFTTTLSSLHTIAMYLYLFHHLESGYKGNVETLVQQIGFNIKFASKASFGHLTFLRGWWIPGSWEWLPLPSQLLKLGKYLSDPTRTFPGPRDQAVGKMAFAISSGYRLVPDDYPLLGPFIRTLARLGVTDGLAHTKLESVIESWAYKVRLTSNNTIFASRSEALLSIEARYGISAHDVENAENLIRQVKTLPALVSHPVFGVLARVDYS